MTLDWQDIAAGSLVLAALGYLARQAWLTMARKKAGGCGGGCRGCGSGQATPNAEEPQVIPLDALTRR